MKSTTHIKVGLTRQNVTPRPWRANVWRLLAGIVLASVLSASWAGDGRVFDLGRAVSESGFSVTLLRAIAMQESGRQRSDGLVQPTPWVVRTGDEHPYHETRQAAEQALLRQLENGRRNIDVGAMQVNLLYNGDLVANPTDLLDPRVNLWAATQVINDCRVRVGRDVRRILACYHGGPRLPAHGFSYADMVLQRASALEGRP